MQAGCRGARPDRRGTSHPPGSEGLNIACDRLVPRPHDPADAPGRRSRARPTTRLEQRSHGLLAGVSNRRSPGRENDSKGGQTYPDDGDGQKANCHEAQAADVGGQLALRRSAGRSAKPAHDALAAAKTPPRARGLSAWGAHPVTGCRSGPGGPGPDNLETRLAARQSRPAHPVATRAAAAAASKFPTRLQPAAAPQRSTAAYA